MVQSTNQVPHVITAMFAVQKELNVSGIGKNSRNDQQKFDFRSADTVMCAMSDLFTKHRLICIPEVQEIQTTVGATKTGTTNYRVIVKEKFTFISAEDGSERTVTTYGEGIDTADKASGKAQTYAYKDAMLKAFNVPVEGNVNNDPDFDSPEVEEVQNPRQAPRAQSAPAPVAREQQKTEKPAAQKSPPPREEGEAADDSDSPEGRVTAALARLVKNEKNRAILEAKVLQAFNVMHLGELTDEQADEAIPMMENFVAAQAKRVGK